jgi:uncharacterized protein (DUF433 family)
MVTLETTQTVPIALGEDGTFRITGSRVTLESIIHQFKSGATPEQIQDDFPSLQLRDIYSVVAYYLQRRQEVDEYLRQQDEAAVQTRQEIESHQDITGLREKLRRRRAEAVK